MLRRDGNPGDAWLTPIGADRLQSRHSGRAWLPTRSQSHGWCATRSHLDKATEIQPLLLSGLETFGPPYLADDVV